ncbi:siphovirus Gp157 family protein [Swingsia samuiensis]|uniref:Uncharacterized protein n=1 Tax=Swingsia samuiensis TaxID=1293412 RepID=A0A4Y6UIL7_9PROT|nr:siphovirus Gp157 family protein [Swingsia samuiensis]QDH17443.1 hypothetical protein E3D00_07605 [Swingsia samuiensis]
MSEVLTKDLRDLVNMEYGRIIKPAMQVFNAEITAIRSANDPISAAVNLIDASERIAKLMKHLSEELRTAVAQEMKETGQFEVEGKGIVASLRAGSTSSQVTDEKALRDAYPDLFIPQPDKLDKARLTKALKTIGAIPGAELTTSKEFSLTIRRA